MNKIIPILFIISAFALLFLEFPKFAIYQGFNPVAVIFLITGLTLGGKGANKNE